MVTNPSPYNESEVARNRSLVRTPTSLTITMVSPEIAYLRVWFCITAVLSVNSRSMSFLTPVESSATPSHFVPLRSFLFGEREHANTIGEAQISPSAAAYLMRRSPHESIILASREIALASRVHGIAQHCIEPPRFHPSEKLSAESVCGSGIASLPCGHLLASAANQTGAASRVESVLRCFRQKAVSELRGFETSEFLIVALASDHETKHAEGEKAPQPDSLIPCLRLYRSIARSIASSTESPFDTG